MKSRVSFEIRDSIPLPLPLEYPEINVRAELNNGTLSAIIVDIEHDDEASPEEIL